MKTDVLIVGSGCAGLYCAMHLPKDKQIMLITKNDCESSDSYLAQGGMCMLKSEDDYQNYFEDTLRAGHYENDKSSVEVMIRSSVDVVKDLLSYNVDFHREENGELSFTREGAHSAKRILFHEDITGKEITSKILSRVKKLPNVTICEYTKMLDIVCDDNSCFGAVIETKDKQIIQVQADYTILATGGIGGLYRHSTNFRHLTGDAVAIAIKHGIKLKDVNYIQIHPTTLYSAKEEDRSFLISESVRGEGAKLYDVNMQRFVNELLPRDLLTKEILKQMEKDGTAFVWEDLRTIPEEELRLHFPNIIEHCKEMGYDVTKECIPVVPAQHYYMGGIKSDLVGKTSMDRLYAIGETACTGVHGKNRLASNSLLESLVFSKRAAKDISINYTTVDTFPKADTSKETYKNIQNEYRSLILAEIEKANKGGLTVKKNGMFDKATLKLNVDPLILSALKEDITDEDISANCVMRGPVAGEAELICKQDGIICGMQIFERVFKLLDEDIKIEAYVCDGDEVHNGELMARVKGDMRTILSGERTALNYLQRMSGMATYTAQSVKILEGTNTMLVDTRKTTPNNRIFEKYAVRTGGGGNHRMNLSDGVLLKDNHIGAAGGVKQAVAMAREYAPFVRKIEVEVESLDMVKEAVEAQADIIMLDNMDHDTMKKAVEIVNGRAKIEVSGNVTKEKLEFLSDLGVDYISSGALTHSAPIMDISLKNMRPTE